MFHVKHLSVVRNMMSDERYTDEDVRKLLEETGVSLSDDMPEKLKVYYEMLVEKNKVMNLTAITDYNDVVIKHFADSLLIASVRDIVKLNKDDEVPELWQAKVADVGTGAGFPGLPLKICAPEAEITLIDSLNKRIGFLNEVIETLRLEKIRAIHGRSEELGQKPEYRERYDYVVSRAVADLSALSEYCLPFVKKGGMFVSYKADGAEEEVKNAANAIKLLGGRLVGVEKRTLPGTDVVRSFVIIKKEAGTPKKYPRKPGTPAKQPL